MITSAKKRKLLASIKKYRKKYVDKKYNELDESATRLMVNSFLSDVLGFKPLDEIRTEYMIRGTYADYVTQIKGKRYFLVEVKAIHLLLSDKHLRQVVNYGANEGIDWALLTNGKTFDFYRILFKKPIESVKVFSIDITDPSKLNLFVEDLQYIHRDCVLQKGLDLLWKKYSALEPVNFSSLLFCKTITNYLKRELRKKYKNKFTDEEIENTLVKLVTEKVELDGSIKFRSNKRKSIALREKGNLEKIPIIQPATVPHV
jgi:hypothetical protein